MSEWLAVAFHGAANVRGNVYRCPNRSAYAGYEFTHPTGMVRLGRGDTVLVRFPDSWTFRLRHRTKPPVELSADAFVGAFRNETAEALAAHDPRAPFLEVVDPEPLAPVEVVTPGDLLNT